MSTEKRIYEAPDGCNIGSVQIGNGRLIVVYECETPEAPKFKRGDFLVKEYFGCESFIVLFDRINENGVIYYNAQYNIKNNTLKIKNDFGIGRIDDNIACSIRIATPEEKQLLLDKMHEQGKDWDGEKIVDWVWRPKVGEPYWVVEFDDVLLSVWDDDATDTRWLKNNQVFATKKLAKKALSDLQTVLKQAKKY